MSAAAQLTPEEIRDFLKLLNEVKTNYTRLDTEFKTFGSASSEALTKMTKLDDAIAELKTRADERESKRIADLEKEVTGLRELMPTFHRKSVGQAVVENEPFMTYIRARQTSGFATVLKGVSFNYKAITGTGVLVPQRLPDIAVGPELPTGVRALIPQGNTTAGAISYLQETAFTNNAAPVAEGAKKPESAKTLAPKTAIVEVIAHLFKVSRQSYDDTPGLAALIDANGLYGIRVAEDNQLLNGTGVSPQLQGFMPIATAAPAPGGTGANLIDAIGAAVFDLAAKGYMPDGIVTNPVDWGAVAMLKNSQGNYLFANPIEYSAIQRIWGVRKVDSSKQTAGTFLVGAFRGNSLLLDREEVGIQIATQNNDDFEKNNLTILIEERLTNMIFNATAFEKGVVPAGTTFEASEPERGNGPRR